MRWGASLLFAFAPGLYKLGKLDGRMRLLNPAGQPVEWIYNRAELETIDISGDPYDEQLVAAVEKAAKVGRGRPLLVGYTWTASVWTPARVAEIRRSVDTASKQQYVSFLKERYAYSIERVNELYGLESTSFTDLLTDRFPKLDQSRPTVVTDDRDFLIEAAGRLAASIAETLKTAHPGALLFSEPLQTTPEIAAAMAQHVDVLVSHQHLPAAKAQVLPSPPPDPLPVNLVGINSNLRQSPIPQK